jgi:Fic family protein
MSFDPTYPHDLALLPPNGIINESYFSELLEARVALAELSGACSEIPNPSLLTAPVVIRESVASSNIENINTTLAEVFQWQLFPETERRQPDKEVLRYREAMLWGYQELDKLPLSSRIITGIQAHLIPDGNGAFRREQNQIANTATREVFYTPPPANRIPDLLGNWENFVNAEDKNIDPLIKAIIAHYQFESIHPFRDGNGRTGRILMILQLVQYGLLAYPVLYISRYINQNREAYYLSLRRVTSEGDWDTYIRFMLHGFQLQAYETRKTLYLMNRLLHDVREKVKKESPKIYSLELIEALFTYPLITPTSLAVEIGIHYTTASKYLSELVKIGILRDTKLGKHHLFSNYKLVDLLG